MKVIKFLFVSLLALLALSSCSKVPAGNVGIKFHLLGSSKGVDYDVLKPGRYYVGFNEELYNFPTFNQTKVWTEDVREGSPTNEAFQFQSRSGLRLSASTSVEYHVNPDNVPRIFEKYKSGLNEVTDKVLRNSLRDAFNKAASTKSAETIYGEGKVEFMQEVVTIAKQEASERGIEIDDIYLVGNIGVPESITKALNARIQATQLAQQRENELRQTKAEAEKEIAKAEGDAKSILIRATAKAEENRIISLSLTKQLVEYKKVEKWDGVLPRVESGGGTLISLTDK